MEISKETQKRLNQAYKHMPTKYFLTFLWWLLFVPRKAKIFVQSIENGMSWLYAYLNAKQGGKS